MEKNKIRKIAKAGWIFLVIGIILMIASGKSFFGYNKWKESKMEINNKGHINLKANKNEHIMYVSAEIGVIELERSNDNKIHYHASIDKRSTLNIREDEDASVNNYEIDIMNKSSFINFGNVSNKITIQVPKNINVIYIENDLGEVNIENIYDLDKLEVLSKVGDIDIRGLSIHNIFAISNNIGGIRVCDVRVESKDALLKINNNIGKTSLEEVYASEYIVFTDIGDIILTNQKKVSKIDTSKIKATIGTKSINVK